MGFKKIALTGLLALGTAASVFADGEQMKFPQFKFRDEVDTDKKFEELGGNLAMYSAIMEQYARYKKEWIRKSRVNGYYVYSQATDGDRKTLTVSEAHGWGMVIMAYMAGDYAPGAKDYFDGLYHFYTNHKLPSSNLMNWEIDTAENDLYIDGFSKDKNSATDGDLDIAYALLLADKQWGSDGDIDYLQAAKNLIKDIKSLDMDQNSKLPKLGAWGGSSDSTRASDWMAGHMRAFADATGDSFWDGAAGEIYNEYNRFIGKHSSAGLISDFLENGGVCNSNFLGESDNILKTNMYGKNACRVPFRFMADYVTSGDADAKAAVQKFAGFITGATEGDASKIAYGYNLDGTPVKTDQNSGQFTAPFMAAALVDAENVDFVKGAWGELAKEHMLKDNVAYIDAIMLMSMLVASGNWWAPGDADTYLDPFDVDTSGAILDHFGNEYGDGNAQCHLGAINGVAWGDSTYGGKGGDTTYYHGGGYWYAYGDVGASIYTLDGKEILGEADTDGTTEMDPIVQQHMLGLNFKVKKDDDKKYGYASLETNFAADLKKDGDKVTSTARYVNLQNLEGITIKYRATGEVKVSISTKDNADAAAEHVDTTDDGSNPWWGKYVAALPAQAMGYYTISKADLVPEAWSPFETLIKANDDMNWEKSGAKAAKEITFTVGEDEDKGADVEFQVHEIILNGIDYEQDLGIKYRPAPIIQSAEMISKKSFAPMITSQGVAVQFNTDKATDAVASLYSLDGKEVAVVNTKASVGVNTLNFSNKNIANGMYVLRLQVGEFVSTARVNLRK